MDQHEDDARDDAPEVTWTDRALRTGRELDWEQLVTEARRRGRDPRFGHLSDDEVERQVRTGAAAITAAMCAWLELLAELVVRGVWADHGARTPGVWLSSQLGVGATTARDHVRVALRLRDLPAVRARFAAGTLSYSKVRAITRVALPEAEDLLLEWADHATAAQLERIVRGLRTAQSAREDASYLDADPRWSDHVCTHADGTATWTVRGPVEEVLAARDAVERLAAATVADRAEADPSRDGPAPPDAHGTTRDHAGATRDHAGTTRDHTGTATDPGGSASDLPDDEREARRVTAADRVTALVDAVAAAAAAGTPPDTSGLDRHTLVLHASAEAVAVPPGGEGPDIVPVRDARGRIRAMDRRVLRRLACQAGVVVVTTDADGSPLDVGRRQRYLTSALRRAVHLRDGGCCTFPGCHATRHLHAHHVHHWGDDGPTDLANLVLICGFHHRFVHDHDWRIEVDPAGRHRYSRPAAASAEAAGSTAVAHTVPLPGASAEAVDQLLGRRSDPPQRRLDALAPPGPHQPFARFDLDTAIAVLLGTYERLELAA